MSDDVRQRVSAVLAEDLLPALAMDGITAEVLAVEGGIVRLRLHGVGVSCPTSVQAVILGVENVLRRRVGEVEHLVIVPDTASG
jgi:Fe-S cluster biogenesis protein NfuA